MKSSNYIAESVFKVKLNYEKMQNETEKLFFRCLDEERSPEYFQEEIEKIWGNVDHAFMDNEIQQYREIIHERITGKEETLVKNDNDLFGLVPVTVLIAVEKMFQKSKEREYTRSITYIENLSESTKDVAKEEYMKMKLGKYTNKNVLYKSHTAGGHDRLVPPSVYNSMIYNTNLTKEGWNQTMEDAELIGANYFVIPYHPFSCPHCIAHQERLLTRSDVIAIAGQADSVKGDILHPNCKCEIYIWNKNKPIPISDLTYAQKEEISIIRQKVNGLTLEKERIRTSMSIAKDCGFNDIYDKLNQQRNKINKEIRTLKEQLPTESLKKQVVAIKR